MKERNIREIKELKPLAALLWILGPALGAACGYFGSKAFSIAYMFDISGIDEKDVNSDIYNSFWSVAFDNEHMQADLVGKYTVIAVVLAVLAIACVIGLMVMTGRFSRDENGKPVLNWFDRLWTEIHLVKKIDMTDLTSAAVGFMTVISMLLTYSIANGIGIGAITYTVITIFTGKYSGKDVMVTIIALLFVLKFCMITM